MWDDSDGDGGFGMDFSGRIAGITTLSVPRFQPVSRSLLRWADQEVRLSALEHLEQLPVAAASSSGEVALAAKRPRIQRDIGAVVAHTEQRHKLVESWTVLVNEIGPSSLTGRQIAGEARAEQEHILKDTLAGKATNTLVRRLGPFRAFFRSNVASGNTWPPTEDNVYRYLREVAGEGDPLSRATSVVEALGFFGSVFDCAEVLVAVNSARIKGLAANNMSLMGNRKQAPPFTAKGIVYLETLVLNGAMEETHLVYLGGFLLIGYLRARYSDVSEILEIGEDLYTVTLSVEKTKNSRRSSDRLPVDLMAPISFSSGTDWYTSWMEFRREIGIPLPDFPVFPSRKDSKWQKTSSSLSAGNTVLRDILEVAGIETPQRYSSHSFKATFLSFACLYGIDLPTRKVLGYHSVSSDKSARSYARDVLREPVLKLRQMFVDMADGVFDPDSKSLGKATEKALELCEESEDEKTDGEDEEILDSVASTTAFLMGNKISVDFRWFQNLDSSLMHRGRPGDLERLACGRQITDQYERMAAVTELDQPHDGGFCDTCFAAHRPEISKSLKRLASTPVEYLSSDAKTNGPTAEELNFDE